MTVAKAIVAVLAAVLAAVVPYMVAGPLDIIGWFNIIALAAGAVAVFNTANIPGWPVAKTIAHAVAVVAVLLMSAWQGGLSTPEILQLVLAFVGTLSVYVVPNGSAATA